MKLFKHQVMRALQSSHDQVFLYTSKSNIKITFKNTEYCSKC